MTTISQVQRALVTMGQTEYAQQTPWYTTPYFAEEVRGLVSRMFHIPIYGSNEEPNYPSQGRPQTNCSTLTAEIGPLLETTKDYGWENLRNRLGWSAPEKSTAQFQLVHGIVASSHWRSRIWEPRAWRWSLRKNHENMGKWRLNGNLIWF